MQYEANSPEEYIAQIPEERQEIMQKLRAIKKVTYPQDLKKGLIIR